MAKKWISIPRYQSNWIFTSQKNGVYIMKLYNLKFFTVWLINVRKKILKRNAFRKKSNYTFLRQLKVLAHRRSKFKFQANNTLKVQCKYTDAKNSREWSEKKVKYKQKPDFQRECRKLPTNRRATKRRFPDVTLVYLKLYSDINMNEWC